MLSRVPRGEVELEPPPLRLAHELLTSRLGKRFHKQAPHGDYTDLGDSAERPVIELPRSCERYLLLMSLDPRFYLSGGMLLSTRRTLWMSSIVSAS